MDLLSQLQFQNRQKESLDKKFVNSIYYHAIFSYPLRVEELLRWSGGEKLGLGKENPSVNYNRGYYFTNGQENSIFLKILRKRVSKRKLEIAKKGIKLISWLPTIRMIAVTGSLAMENAAEDSDIDLMVVTAKGSLWTSRLLVYLLLKIFAVDVRQADKKTLKSNQKDKFCLNMWLDESDLKFSGKKRNAYTAHEIAAVKPLINKEHCYQKFILENKWIKDYWPNSVRIQDSRSKNKDKNKIHKSYISNLVSWFIEPLAFWLQYWYMRKKITREKVTRTQALFHPIDWGKIVLAKL